MDNTVLEYLEGYFGNELNESISDEDIMEAFYDLLETADAVRAFLGEDSGGNEKKEKRRRDLEKWLKMKETSPDVIAYNKAQAKKRSTAP
jgi:hypothetical protein